MPAVGLGTWQSKPNEVREAVKAALLAGYRHIDTALAYGNEAEVGQGIKDSGVPREEIWVTTKLDNPWHKRVEEGITSSLKDLGPLVGRTFLGTPTLTLNMFGWCSSATITSTWRRTVVRFDIQYGDI